MRLIELYTKDNRYLRDYLRTGEDNPDHYEFWNEFADWYEREYDDLDNLLKDMRVGSAEEFGEDPELFYYLPEDVQKAFIAAIKDELVQDRLRDDPAEAPTWAHMSISKPQLLPRTTWLIHFSDNAYSIAIEGFTQGIDNISRLGLTTYFSDHAKRYGGFNFAFLASSRHALPQRSSRYFSTHTYGKHAVMFQNSGVLVHHYGDEEDQVIFWGKDVDPRDMVLIDADQQDWIVQVHPSKSRGGQETKQGGVFKGSPEETINWVRNNANQYRKVITGR